MSSKTTPVKLDSAALSQLEARVATPTYDRAVLRPSIVHVGVGGFHRAHLATYVHELCEAGHTDWSIIGAGVLEADATMAEVLEDQDYLYTLITRGPDDTVVDVIGSITGFVLGAQDSTPLIELIAAPSTQIISLTVTEGGYPIEDLTGLYNSESPAAGPGTAFAIIAAGLDARRRSHGQPLTIVSCDNIISNGDAAHVSTVGEAAGFGDELTDWIAESVSFPNSMVDRITPTTSQSDRDWLSEECQIADRWPVVTEPFRQWVIEDDFAGERLPLDELDVIVTDDVEPYELMKLRLLNAGHSCIAYLSALQDFTTVDIAMADPLIRQFLDAFLRIESAPVLADVPGIDIDAYIQSLVERFSNPEIGDQINRLCLDGSAKFPKFLLPTIRAQVENSGPIELASLALAGWCEYLRGTTENGNAIEIASDPLLDAATKYAAMSVEEPDAFLNFEDVFGDLNTSDDFRAAFTSSLDLLRTLGVASSINTLLERPGPGDRASN